MSKSFPLGLLLRLSGAIIALTVLFFIVDSEKLFRSIYQANIAFLFSAFLIAFASPLLTSIRLKLFLKVTGTRIAYDRCLLACLSGLSLNLFLPARGGDLVKLAYLRKDGKPSWERLAGAAILERGFDIVALGLIGSAVSFCLGLSNLSLACGLVSIAASLGLLLLPKMESIPVIGKKAKNFISIYKNASQKKHYLLICFLSSCTCWTANSMIMGFLLKAFDESLSMTHAFAATPPSILTGIIPVTLWGLGTRDGAIAYFLSGLTAPENAISAGFLYTALVYWFLGLMGLPALIIARRKTKTFIGNPARSDER